MIQEDEPGDLILLDAITALEVKSPGIIQTLEVWSSPQQSWHHIDQTRGASPLPLLFPEVKAEVPPAQSARMYVKSSQDFMHRLYPANKSLRRAPKLLDLVLCRPTVCPWRSARTKDTMRRCPRGRKTHSQTARQSQLPAKVHSTHAEAGRCVPH
jgi:hypothetical protein